MYIKTEIQYNKLLEQKFTDTKSLVISENVKVSGKNKEFNGYTLAQRYQTTKKSGEEIDTFLKGSIHVDDIEGLQKLRDILNIAIKKLEAKDIDDVDWDTL